MDTVTTSCTCTSATRRSDEVRHPLDPLTAAEIRVVVQIVRDDPQYGADFLFETIELLEPEKSVVRQYRSGEPINRTARVNLFKVKQDGIWRLTISLTQEKVLTSRYLPTAKPMIQLEQFTAIEDAVRAAPEFIEACKKRGIGDMSLVCIDPWSAGNFGIAGEDERHVPDAALLASLDELGSSAHRIFDGRELLELDHRLGRREIPGGKNLLLGQGDGQSPDAVLLDLEEIDSCSPVDRLSGSVLAHDGLFRLQKFDRLKEKIGAILGIIADDLHHDANFGGSQGIERVSNFIRSSG